MLAALLCASCWTIDSADLVRIGAKHGLLLSESECEEGTVTPVSSIQVAKGGFYIFGLLPIVKVSLDEAIDELALQAKKLDADGVCDIRYHYSPANVFKFIVVPIPDWSASIQVFGMAYKAEPAPAPYRHR